MCNVLDPACRFCLSEDRELSRLNQIEEEHFADEIATVLGLDTNLLDKSLYPRHICGTCMDVIQQFITLRELALESERFLLRYQSSINQSGIKAARIKQGEVDVKEELTESEDINTNKFEVNDHPIEEAEEEESCELVDDENLVDENDTVNLESGFTYCKKCGPSRILKIVSLPKHMKEYHKIPDIECTFPGCFLKFKRKFNMEKHVRLFHNKEKSLCIECGGSFQDLHIHIKMVHQKVLVPCDVCGKEYSSKQSMLTHKNHTHGDLQKEICDFCSAEVRYLQQHIKLKHSGEVKKVVACQDVNCDRMFRTKPEAIAHYKYIHVNMKEMCQLCGGWFKNLGAHNYSVHNNQKKHVCEECGKAFGKKYDLKCHKDRVHLQKRYICPECGKTISKIREHLKLVHGVTNVNMDQIKDVQAECEVYVGKAKQC